MGLAGWPDGRDLRQKISVLDEGELTWPLMAPIPLAPFPRGKEPQGKGAKVCKRVAQGTMRLVR